jgi:lambda family phage tail tape measure protein
MADEQARATLSVAVDAEGAKAGAAEVERALKGIDDAATKAASSTGQALDAIASGAAQAGGAMTGAQQPAKGLEESLKGLTAEAQRYARTVQRQAEQLTRSKADYAELKAARLGVTETLAPYIERMREEERGAQMAAVAEREYAESLKEAERSRRAGDALVNALRREAEQAGLDAIAIKELQAAYAGRSEEVAPYIAKLRAQEQAAKEAAIAQRQLDEATRRSETEKSQGTAFLANLRSMADQAGKTKVELLQLEAAQRGLSKEAAPDIARYAAQVQAAEQAAAAQRALNEAKREEARVQAEGTAFIERLRREEQQATMTRVEILKLDAARLGVADSAAPMIQRLEELDRAHGKAGMSARQHAMAMRMLPAQITDVVVSLVSGQPAYLVALQQGGQIKDMFGGIGPAARAMIGAITPAAVAFTGLAAAIGLVGAAWYQGAAENDAYVRSLAQTGNYIGVTTGQLHDMARAIGETTGTGQGKAAEAIAALAQSGNIAAGSMKAVGEAIVLSSTIGGRAVQELVREYEELGKKPVEASLKLNEQYKYLTVEIYNQITALEEQGRTAEAAEVAQKAYADAQKQRNLNLYNDLGTIERAWISIKNAAAGAWSEMRNIGRPVTATDTLKAAEDRLAKVKADLAAAESGPRRGTATSDLGPLARWFATPSAAALQKAESDVAAARLAAIGQIDAAATKAAENERAQLALTAEQRRRTSLDSGAPRSAKRAQELEKSERDFAAIRANANAVYINDERRRQAELKKIGEEEARDRRQIEERYKDQAGPRARQPAAYREDAGTKMLDDLQRQQAVLDAQLRTEEKLGPAARARASFEQMIADLKEKKQLTADQKAILAVEAKLRLEHNILVAKEESIALIKEEAKEEEKAEKERQKARDKRLEDLNKWDQRWAQIQDQMASAQQGRNEGYDRTLDTFGKGDRAREIQQAQETIYKEYARYENELRKSTPKDMLGSDQYKDRVRGIQTELNNALNAHNAYYTRLAELQGNWLNGANQAFANYMDSTRNVAEQTQRLFTSTLGGLENVLTDFFSKGKADWKSFGNAIVAEIVRIIVRTRIMSQITPIIQGQANGSGWFGTFLNSLIGGAVRGAPGIGATPSGTPMTGSFPMAPNIVAANGAVVGASGAVDTFANGGLVTDPTFFGHGGGMGLMGEAGYEAIMPVARTASGELGVKMAGGSNTRGGDTVVINLNGFRGDSNELRLSGAQIASRVTSELGRARRVM